MPENPYLFNYLPDNFETILWVQSQNGCHLGMASYKACKENPGLQPSIAERPRGILGIKVCVCVFVASSLLDNI